jgi:MFS family permease
VQPGRQPLWPSQPSQPVPAAAGAGRGSSAEWPAWSLIGPALGALMLLGMLGATLGSDPDARRVFGLSLALIVVVTVGYLVAAVGGAAVGLFVGRRWPAAVAGAGMGVMLAGILATALSPNVLIMVVGQVLAGLGGGAAAGTAVGLLPRLGSRRTQATLGLAIGAAVAFVLGLAVGYGVAMVASWRLPFLLSVPLAMVAGAVAVAGGIVRLVVRLSR